MTEKKTRKSVPRPGSGRRGKDGAVGLVPKLIKFTPDQAAKIRRNGSAWVRQVVEDAPEIGENKPG